MPIPISAIKLLERKEASALRRVESLKEALTDAEAELREIQEAILAIDEGRRINLQYLIGEVRFTQKDHVFAAVKKRPSSGMTRSEIVEYIWNEYGIDISPAAVTTYLHKLSVEGLVEFDGVSWKVVKK